MLANRPVTIYISAATELMGEREALAQMIAKLPVTLAWHIVQTPREGELVNTLALGVADLFFLIMGSDIQAPIGSEWHLAQQSRRQVIAFLKQGMAYTPAGQVFVRETRVNWRPFTDAAHLSRQVQALIIEHLLGHAIEYGLTPVEVTGLGKKLAETASTPTEEAKGTGHSAILISRERYTPSEGVIIGEDEL
jgi:hypothetical protein